MKLIEQRVELVKPVPYKDLLEKVEQMGRLCYKSEDKIKEDSAEKFIRGLIKSGHGSVIEHASMTLKFTTNRAMTHQIVRHRLCNFSQESQRYCNYSDGKFGDDMLFIKPIWYDDVDCDAQYSVCKVFEQLETEYAYLVKMCGLKAEQARDLLPNACKAEIGVTANMREWRHIFKERCFGHADPMIKDLMGKALEIAYACYPVFFEDLADNALFEDEARK